MATSPSETEGDEELSIEEIASIGAYLLNLHLPELIIET